MTGTAGIGIQDFSSMIVYDYFYTDKRLFIKSWPGSQEVRLMFKNMIR